jgi:hypothetical protein
MSRLHAALEIQHGAMRGRAENAIGAARQHAGADQRLLHGAHIIAALERQAEAEFSGEGHNIPPCFKHDNQ